MSFLFLLALTYAHVDARDGPTTSDDIDAIVASIAKARNACGPIALSYVLRGHGFSFDTQAVINQSNLSEKGLSLSDLCSLANAHGVNCKAIEVTSKKLSILPTPSILVINSNHVVVYEGHNQANAAVFEPARGKILHIPLAELTRFWSGEAIVFDSLRPSTFQVVNAFLLAVLLTTLSGWYYQRRELVPRANSVNVLPSLPAKI